MSDEERRGSIETFEEALDAIEFLQTSGEQK